MTNVIPGLAPGWEVPSMGRRIGSRCIDGALNVFLVLPPYFMFLNSSIGLGALLFYLLLLTVVFFGVQFLYGASVGQLLLGHRNIDVDTGQPSGPRTVGKNLLISVGSQVSCGLLPIVAVVTADGPFNQTWFDKWLGVVVLRRSAGAPPIDETPAILSMGAPLAYPAQAYAAPAYAQPVEAPPAYVPPTDEFPVDAAYEAPPWAQAPAPVAAPSQSSPGLGPDRTEVVPIRDLSAKPGNLVLDNGQVFSLAQPIVLGRDPVPSADHPEALPVAVADAARSISKTHVLIGPELDGAFVIDLHSTNGVAVTPPGGEKVLLTAGEKASVPFGSTVFYGQRSVEVTR